MAGAENKASPWLDPAVHQYLLQQQPIEHPSVQYCRQLTAARADARKQIDVLTGQYLGFLVQLLQPTRILELGTYTGCSGLIFALAAPRAQIFTCDQDRTALAIAAHCWQHAKVSTSIQALTGPIVTTLQLHSAQWQQQPFDCIFIDADKRRQIDYIQQLLPCLADKGVMVLDNSLWRGEVVDPRGGMATAIERCNDWLTKQTNLYSFIMPIGDGITVIGKRG